MIDPSKKALLRVVSALMLICALPMLLWCLGLINNAATDSTFSYAGLGCFWGAALRLFNCDSHRGWSLPGGLTGIAGAGWAYVQLAAAVRLVSRVPMGF